MNKRYSIEQMTVLGWIEKPIAPEDPCIDNERFRSMSHVTLSLNYATWCINEYRTKQFPTSFRLIEWSGKEIK